MFERNDWRQPGSMGLHTKIEDGPTAVSSASAKVNRVGRTAVLQPSAEPAKSRPGDRETFQEVRSAPGVSCASNGF